MVGRDPPASLTHIRSKPGLLVRLEPWSDETSVTLGEPQDLGGGASEWIFQSLGKYSLLCQTDAQFLVVQRGFSSIKRGRAVSNYCAQVGLPKMPRASN